MKKVQLPLAGVLTLVADFTAQRAEMVAAFGEPHYTETDPQRTFGGAEEYWAFALSDDAEILLDYVPDAGRGVVVSAYDPDDGQIRCILPFASEIDFRRRNTRY